MAGLRCGFVIARPDLLEKVLARGGQNFMPVTAIVAATASLKDPQLVSERRRINATHSPADVSVAGSQRIPYIPSESNCFLLDTKRPGKEVRDAMAKENVLIGRVWPIMPTYVRITVGTQEEMERFQAAFQKVMKAISVARAPPPAKARADIRLGLAQTSVHSGASVHRTLRPSRLLLCASRSARIVRNACSGVTSSGVPFSIASRTLA